LIRFFFHIHAVTGALAGGVFKAAAAVKQLSILLALDFNSRDFSLFRLPKN
jgi:hypothetical protein